MYCPACFNDSLYLKPKGVVDVIINGKQMDSGRILFTLESHRKTEVQKDLLKKIEEFFKWYSNFHNRTPIKNVSLLTLDFKCSNSCALPLNQKISVVGHLISRKKLKKELEKLAEKYQMTLELEL